MYQKIKPFLPYISIAILLYILLGVFIFKNENLTDERAVLKDSLISYNKYVTKINKEKEELILSIEQDSVKIKELQKLNRNLSKELKEYEKDLIKNKKDAQIKKTVYSNNTFNDRIDLFTRLVIEKDSI